MDGVTIELANPEQQLVSEAENPHITRKQIAMTYALAIVHSEAKGIDWKRVNAAILKRWSASGLNHIKNLAWSGKAFK